MVDALVEETRAACGRIDFLVTSAGILFRSAFTDITPSEWDLMMGVNLKGTYLCCRSVVPVMIRQGGGVIVNISLSEDSAYMTGACVDSNGGALMV